MKLDNLGTLESIQKSRLKLSVKDVQILQLIADSYYEVDIADIVGYSLQGLKNRKRKIYEVLGAECAAHAVALAFRKGLIE